MIVECANCGWQFCEGQVNSCCGKQEIENPLVLRAKEDFLEGGDIARLEAELDDALRLERPRA